jgi:hypothetical protein
LASVRRLDSFCLIKYLPSDTHNQNLRLRPRPTS